MYRILSGSLTLLVCLVITPAVLADDTGPAVSAAPARIQGLQLAQGMMGQGGMMDWSRRSQWRSGTAPDATRHTADALSRFVSANGLTCFSCHANSARRVGPSFNAIAHRYAGRAKARRQLARSIRQGVSGRWNGFPPMPPAQATPAQADQLARLILESIR